MTNPIAKLEALGAAGLVISICYGATPRGLGYSVDCLHDASKESFARPFAARDFAHCLEIVETEAIKRGWLTPAAEAQGAARAALKVLDVTDGKNPKN